MKPPTKKKQKRDLTNIEKAFIVKTLRALRDNEEMAHLYRRTLQKVVQCCGYSKLTIVKWLKPSETESIYQKANEMIDSGGVLVHRNFSDMFSDISLDSSIFLMGKFSLNNDVKAR